MNTILYLLALSIMILAIILSVVVPSIFKKWNTIHVVSGVTGIETAQRILSANDICDVNVNNSTGNLSDHYNPTSKTVSLSTEVANNSSVGALAVAAHECGHAIQHHEGYKLLTFGDSLSPLSNISARAGVWLCVLGFAFSSPFLPSIGVVFLAFATLFRIIIFPIVISIELNASKRAITLLKNGEMLQSQKETCGAKKVLSAAAMTHVTSILAEIVQLLIFIISARN